MDSPSPSLPPSTLVCPTFYPSASTFYPSASHLLSQPPTFYPVPPPSTPVPLATTVPYLNFLGWGSDAASQVVL